MPEREGERSARDIITVREARNPKDGKPTTKVGGDVKEIAQQLESIPLLPEEQDVPTEVEETTAPVAPSTEPAKDKPQSALRTAPETAPTEPEPVEEVEPEPDDLPPDADEPEPVRQPNGRKLRLPDGTTQWVTVDEAFAGYLRQSDYTRKRQAEAERERATEARFAEATKLRDHYAAKLQELEETLTMATPQEPNWAEERKRLPPEQYLDLRETWDAYKKNRDSLSAESTRVAEEKRKAFETQRKTFVEQESQKLLDRIPGWTDDETYAREFAQMLRHAKALGFSPEEVNGTVDHRLLVLLREATLGRATRTNEPAPGGEPAPRKKSGIVRPIRTVSPGSALDGVPRPSERKTEKRRAFDRLRKSGRKEDAVAVFEHLIDEGAIE